MAKRTRRTTRLESWLNTDATPVFLLSVARKVVFFNSGCERLTGWSAEEVVGQACDYNSDTDPATVESLTNSLCPPPDVFEGQPVRVPAYFAHRNGNTVARLLQFFPLKDEDGHVESILGLVTPIEQPTQSATESPARQLHAELAALRLSLRQKFGVSTIVCQSATMFRVLQQITLARSTGGAVHLQGERGAGKEHIARLIHYESEFRSHSFVPLDCAKLPALQLKQTLQRLLKPNRDESQTTGSLQPGTVYLADVDHLPLDVQANIVATFQPSDNTQSPALRLMSSSTSDLRQAIDDDRLIRELFYLLTPLQIEIPPLRHRTDDLMPLAQSFLERSNCGSEKQLAGFDNDVSARFIEYNWPANVDELIAVVEESWAACETSTIRISDLPFRFNAGFDAQAVGPVIRPKPRPLEPFLLDVEKQQIQAALQSCRNNKTKAAELLGITRPKLYRRMQVLGIADLESSD